MTGLGLVLVGLGGGNGNDRFGFDFDQKSWVDELADLNHGGDRTDGAEEFAVGATDRLPLGDVGDEHAGANNVIKRSTGLRERSLNGAEGLHGLEVRIAKADDALRSDRSRAGDKDVLTDVNRAGIADNRLPWPAAGDVDAHVSHAESLTLEEGRTDQLGEFYSVAGVMVKHHRDRCNHFIQIQPKGDPQAVAGKLRGSAWFSRYLIAGWVHDDVRSLWHCQWNETRHSP